MNEWLHIVGINPSFSKGGRVGFVGLPGEFLQGLPGGFPVNFPDDTVLLVGAPRLQEFFPDFKGQRLFLKGNLDPVIAQIRSYRGQIVVVLASGDPNFYGIAATLLQHFDPQEVAIYPAVSSMQLAFARAKIPWHDAALISLHGRPIHHLAQVWHRSKIGIFTDSHNTPARIASFLLERGVRDGHFFLMENLGYENEKITQGTLPEFLEKESEPLNILLIIKADSESPFRQYPSPGLPEREFFHTQGLITKSEVRSAVLSHLRPEEDSILWDVGAGSGSVSVEASRFIRSGLIFAVEKKPQEVENIIKNRQKFQVLNLEIIPGEAPSILADLPDPDRIFLGGSGRSLESNLKVCWQRLKEGGRIIVNAVTLESLAITREFLSSRARNFDVTGLQIYRKKILAGLTTMEPLLPVYILAGEKSE